MAENNNDPQLDLAEIVEIAPDDLSDDQKIFLETNVDDLTDEQATTFGLKKTPPPPVEPEVRTKPPAKKPDEPPTPLEEEDDPEDVATIGRVVTKTIKPLQEQIERQTESLQATKNENEVDTLIREKPEFAPYRSRILTYMKHPAYLNIPAENIAMMPNVAGKDLMKLGAEKEREAAGAAADSKGAGGTARKAEGGGKNWLKASKEEFEAEKARVMGRQV